MKITNFFLLIISLLPFASCSNKNEVLPVSGTINGVPALTLYGNSNRNADFVLLSTKAGVNELSYNGTAYNYAFQAGTDIFISLSTINIQRGSLTTSSTRTVLTLYYDSATVFASSVYTSK